MKANSITIFGKPYIVSYVDTVDEEDSSGECDPRSGEIKILKTMCDAQKKTHCCTKYYILLVVSFILGCLKNKYRLWRLVYTPRLKRTKI